ncbi:hypothetical protein ACXWN3_09935, partial [Streptococcus pyogenes]
GENLEQWGTFPGLADVLELLNHSSRRSQKTPEQHLKNCMCHLSQLSLQFMIQQKERGPAKMASMGEFKENADQKT